MTPQSHFMIVATIVPEKEQALRGLLASINSQAGFADPKNELVPFYQFPQLHVARFVIIRANTNSDIQAHGVTPDEWQPRLAFLGDIDGRVDMFLAELVIRAGQGLRTIFSHCKEMETNEPSLLAWLHKHNQKPAANYVNWRGRTVLQIKQELALCDALRSKYSEISSSAKANDSSAEVIHQQLQDFAAEEIATLRLRLDPPVPTPAGWWLCNVINLLALPVVVLLLSPLMLLGLPFFLWYLRRLERTDPENRKRADHEHLLSLTNQEDIDVTNHFNVFGQVKPGMFRKLTIRFLLWVLDYASRHVYRCGFLARIQTIHFARWVLLDNNQRVYFASNYDGSADSYMDDFINKVAWGLNLVFSNGVGYPKTRWLIKGGAEHESNYKKTLRRNQLPSESWYKAYPGLTAVDLARNSSIRQGLMRNNPNAKQISEWLGLLTSEKST